MTKALCLPAIMMLAFFPIKAQSQRIYAAPTETEADQIRRLANLVDPAVFELTVRATGRGDNNVVSLANGTARTSSREIYNGGNVYFNMYENSEIAIRRGLWRFGYSWSQGDLYLGNHDGGQLYLDSLTGSVDPTNESDPAMTMNRSSLSRLQAAYETPLHIAGRPAGLHISASILRMQKVRLGTLSGETVNGKFTGMLDFISTLGVAPSETRSDGLTIDAGMNVEMNSRLRIGISCENLASWLRQRGLNTISANVSTNTIVADGDGFIYGAPLLSGTYGSRELDTSFRPCLDLGAAYRQRNMDWLLLIHNDWDWRTALGATGSLSRRDRWWAVAWIDPFEWQAGLDWRCLRLQFGMSDINPDAARRATLSLTWRIGLGGTK